jgi:hypothetical protein
MILAMVVSVVLVSITILMHYEALRLTSQIMPRLTMVRPHGRIIFVIFAVFAAHTAEVYLYAIGYWILVVYDPASTGAALTHVEGGVMTALPDFVYFSIVTFTTTGFGDVIPHGALRLIAGVESLNGLVMIGWSASFTYLWMERLWPLHARRGQQHHATHHRRT